MGYSVRNHQGGWAKPVFLVLAVVILATVAWTWFALSWSYSDGERAGVLQKCRDVDIG